MTRTLLLAILSALLAAPAAAQYSVTTTVDDATPGTLRTSVTNANAAPGNPVTWGAGGEGTISLLSDLPALNDGSVLDVSAAVSSVTLLGPGSISLLGASTFKNASATNGWLIADGISGAGSLLKVGGGTLTLTGANSYSGGTYLQAGVLDVGSSSLGSGPLTFAGGTLQTPYVFTIGSSVTLNAGNGFFELQGGTLTLSGRIGGAGALVLNSTGSLILSGANTYTGGTEAHGGILNINARAALGTGVLLLDGATLQITTDITMSTAVTLARGASFDTNTRDLTLSGALIGSGGLTKIGLGTLSLGAVGGASIYTGTTTIAQGTLRLDADDTLPSATDLKLAAGACLEVGSHTQAVAGFVGAGTTRMVLTAGTTNLVVAGNADLTGGTFSMTTANPLVRAGDVFVPLTYGSRNGESQLAIVSPAAIKLNPLFYASSMTVTVSFVPFADSAANDNQGAIGRALEPLRANPVGDAATVLSSLYTLDAPHLQAALDQIGPISLASMRGMGMTAASVHASSLGRRMTLLADDRGRLPTYAVKGPAYPGTLSAAAPGDVENWARSTGRALTQPWSLYMSGVGTTGKLQEANSPSGFQPGYAFNTGGLIGGMDYRLGDHMAAGFSLGYLRGHASVYAPASGTVDDQSLRYGVYVTRFGDGFHANLYLGGASDFFTTKRGIVFGDISRVAEASSSGQELNLDTSVGYDWRLSDWGTFSPFAGLDYDRLMIGSFQESGADSLNLKVGAQTSQSLRSSLGLRCSQDFKTESMLITPYLSGGWRRELKRQTQPITAQLASGASGEFSVASGNFARDGTLFGTGLVLSRGEDIELKLDYLGDFRSHYVESAYNASLRFKF